MHTIKFSPDTIELTASRDVRGNESGSLWLEARNFSSSIPIVRGTLPRERLSLTAQVITPSDEDNNEEVNAKYGCGYVDYVHAKATYAEQREAYLSAVFTVSEDMMGLIRLGAKDARNSRLVICLAYELKLERAGDLEVWDVFESKRVMLTMVSLALSVEPASDA